MPIARPAQLALTFTGIVFALLGAGCASTAPTNIEKANPISEISTQSYDSPGLSKMDTAPYVPPPPPPLNTKVFGIGAVLPLQGRHADFARSLQHGLELAVAEVNAAGGINGQPVQLDILDSQGEAYAGSVALGKLRDRGERILLVGDAPLAVAEATRLANFPQLVGFLTDYVAVPKQTPKNGVRLYLNGDQEGRAIRSYLAAAAVDRVSIVHVNDLLGESHKQYLLYLISDDHTVATSDEAYTPGERDFDLLARAMARSSNGALVLAGEGLEYSRILAAFDGAAWKGLVFGYADEAALTSLGGNNLLSASAAYPLPDFAVNPRNTEAGRAFADKYKAKYGEEPTLPAAYAYDNIHALAAAAAQAASNEPLKIRASFISLRNYVGAVGRYEIKDDGDTEMPLRLLHANGQPVTAINRPAAAPVTPDLSNLKILPLTAPSGP